MGVLLDLSAYKDETADIRMENGAVLHLRKPTEKMVIHMMQMRDITENTPPLEILATLNRVAAEILNNNADGITFKPDAVTAMMTDTKTAIIEAYSDWATNLQANPTISRPESETNRPEATGKLRRWFGRLLNTRD